MFFLFRALIQFSSPAHSVTFLSQTLLRLCHRHLCFHLVRFPVSSSIILVCRECNHLVLLPVDSFILSRTKVTNLYLSSSVFSFSCSHPVFFASSFRSDFIPNITTIVPSPLMFPSCAVSCVFFHHSCLLGVPPSRTSPGGQFHFVKDECDELVLIIKCTFSFFVFSSNLLYPHIL